MQAPKQTPVPGFALVAALIIVIIVLLILVLR